MDSSLPKHRRIYLSTQAKMFLSSSHSSISNSKGTSRPTAQIKFLSVTMLHKVESKLWKPQKFGLMTQIQYNVQHTKHRLAWWIKLWKLGMNRYPSEVHGIAVEKLKKRNISELVILSSDLSQMVCSWHIAPTPTITQRMWSLKELEIWYQDPPNTEDVQVVLLLVW